MISQLGWVVKFLVRLPKTTNYLGRRRPIIWLKLIDHQIWHITRMEFRNLTMMDNKKKLPIRVLDKNRIGIITQTSINFSTMGIKDRLAVYKSWKSAKELSTQSLLLVVRVGLNNKALVPNAQACSNALIAGTLKKEWEIMVAFINMWPKLQLIWKKVLYSMKKMILKKTLMKFLFSLLNWSYPEKNQKQTSDKDVLRL